MQHVISMSVSRPGNRPSKAGATLADPGVQADAQAADDEARIAPFPSTLSIKYESLGRQKNGSYAKLYVMCQGGCHFKHKSQCINWTHTLAAGSWVHLCGSEVMLMLLTFKTLLIVTYNTLRRESMVRQGQVSMVLHCWHA